MEKDKYIELSYNLRGSDISSKEGDQIFPSNCYLFEMLFFFSKVFVFL